MRTSRQRYADLALRLNIKQAAEQLAEQKLAEKMAAAGIAPAPPAEEDSEARIRKDVQRMRDFDNQIDACLANQEVKIA